MYLLLIILNALSQSTDCDRDNDCRYLNECVDDECKHKSLFSPDWTEIIATLLILISAAIANAGGIGAGPLMVTILVLVFFFDPTFAVPLVQVILFGGSLMAVIYKFRLRHPNYNRPLILFEYLMILQPPLLIGTTFGVEVFKILPSWLIIFLLVILLCFICYTIGKRGIGLYKSESLRKSSVTSMSIQVPTNRDDQEKNVLETENMIQDNNNGERNQISEELQKVFSYKAKIFPIKEASFMVAIWIIFVLASFMKGGQGFDSIIGIEQCSAFYWIFLVIFAILVIGITILVGIWLLKRDNYLTKIGFEWQEGDIKWSKRNILIFGCFGFFAGLLSGCLGVGGGLLIGPLLISYKVPPQCVTATSSFAMLFTSSIALLQFVSAGLIPLDYGLLLFTASFIGAGLGILVIGKIVIKYNRSSIILITLCSVLLISMIAILIYGLITIADKEDKGTMEYGFKDSC